eukprot:2453160-Pyramimonas_sp.AAC.1
MVRRLHAWLGFFSAASRVFLRAATHVVQRATGHNSAWHCVNIARGYARPGAAVSLQRRTQPCDEWGRARSDGDTSEYDRHCRVWQDRQ